MRNASRGQILPPLPFDPLAGLEVIEPRNKMETDQAWREYERLTWPADQLEVPAP